MNLFSFLVSEGSQPNFVFLNFDIDDKGSLFRLYNLFFFSLQKPGLNPNATVYKPADVQWDVNVNGKSLFRIKSDAFSECVGKGNICVSLLASR